MVVRLTPLGDRAVLAYLPDEAAAVRFATAVRSQNPPWLEDVVPAYASVGIFFDRRHLPLAVVMHWLQSLSVPPAATASPTGLLHQIPVCYERQQDLGRICEHTGLSSDQVIDLHQAAEYQVDAIGFVPGFPYLGYLPEALCGVGRLASPRLRVEPGSVGLTGRQTGIYPLPRPGGWNILGQTPLTIVDVEDGFFPMRVGDRVRFFRIDESEFTRLQSERLPLAPL